MSTTLCKIAIMNLQQMRQWIALTTKGKHFIPSYSGYGYSAKCAVEDGLLTVQDEVLMDAIRGTHKRVDSRSLTIEKAAIKGDFFTIAATLASAHRTYMSNHGFKSNTNKNIQFNLAITAKIKQEELEQAKADMIALQLNSIGSILGAKKAHKKGCLQGFFDFEESECILNKMSGSFEFGDLTPAVSF